MGCERFEETLWEAAEGELSPELAEHLGKCPTCRQALETVRDAHRGLVALRTVNAPDARAAVRARVIRWPTRNIFVPAAISAAVVCVVMGLVLLHTWRGRTPAPRAAPMVTRLPKSSAAPRLAATPEAPPRAAKAVRQARSEPHRARRRVMNRPARAIQAARAKRPQARVPRGSPTRTVQVNPASEISDISVEPVIVDPTRMKPTRHYTVMVPGRTDPVKQYTVMIPGRTDPYRQYTATVSRPAHRLGEHRIVLDPTYRRLPEREVIVLSDPEQPSSTMEIGEN